MNKLVKKSAAASTVLLTGMYAVNKYIDTCVTPMLPSKNDKKFIWKNMQINYTEKGNTSNPPLLLLHNLDPSFSKEEWYRVDDLLARNFHIFEFDLLGCGKSEKPNETYINYMYVQLLSCFIKEVIHTKVNVCASAFSCSFTFMAARFHPELIDKIIVINPASFDELVKPVTKKTELAKKIIEFPVIGTFIYNCKMSKSSIWDNYKYVYFYNDTNVPIKAVNISYYNAHHRHSSGRYLFGSIVGNYTTINIIHTLSKLNNAIYLIGNRNWEHIIQEYKKCNPNIHAMYVSHCRLLPHLEIPQTIVEKINLALMQ